MADYYAVDFILVMSE